jgi:hypothetical protein
MSFWQDSSRVIVLKAQRDSDGSDVQPLLRGDQAPPGPADDRLFMSWRDLIGER